MNIVIIGASHAGISAAIDFGRYKKNCDALQDVDITILEQGDGTGFSFVGADGLFWVSGLIPEDHTGYTTPDAVRQRGIDLRLNAQVTDIDTNQKQIKYTDTTTQNTSEITYDYLILATGSRPIIPDFAVQAVNERQIITSGGKVKPVSTMKDYADAVQLKSYADNPDIKKVTVVGGGYIGVETAETMQKIGLDVEIVQGASRVMNTYYDQDFTDIVEDLLRKKGIKLQFDTRFSDFNAPEFSDTDAFVLAIGFGPQATLLDNELEKVQNAYKVDRQQLTSNPDIYAIGDCSISYNNVLDDYMYIAIGSNTAREAAIVADQIAHRIVSEQNKVNCCPALNRKAHENKGTQGSNALTVYGLNVAATGLNYEAATRFGFKAEVLDFTGEVLDHIIENPFIPDDLKQDDAESVLAKGKLKIRIVYEAETYRILGFQAMSYADPSAYVHMFSLAIAQHLTLNEIKNIDLFFSPLLNQLYNHITRILSKF